MFGYFYHSTIKKAVVAFGSLFNDIHIARYNQQGNEIERIKVPLAYMSKQLFISRFLQSADLAAPFAISLPRMSFNFSQISYDSTRKNDSMQRTMGRGVGETKYAFRYGRVPYNLNFNLNIYTKNTDDSLQIIEQILPWFVPEYSVNIRMLNTTDQSVDVPFILQGVNIDEEGADTTFDSRKIVVVSLEFVCKMFFYGPVRTLENKTLEYPIGNITTIPEGMVGKVILNHHLDENMEIPFETIKTGIVGNVVLEDIKFEQPTYLVYGNEIFA
jgi:hypothetical protein